jgi:hypothetical protein
MEFLPRQPSGHVAAAWGDYFCRELTCRPSSQSGPRRSRRTFAFRPCSAIIMLRTSLIMITRRLAHLRNTPCPNAFWGQRLLSGQFPQHNFRSVALCRRLGVYACAATAALVVYHSQIPVVLLDARPDSLESTRGLSPQVCPKQGMNPLALVVVVEPQTKVEFPKTIHPHSCPPMTLIGAGVRTVSFLRIKGEQVHRPFRYFLMYAASLRYRVLCRHVEHYSTAYPLLCLPRRVSADLALSYLNTGAERGNI